MNKIILNLKLEPTYDLYSIGFADMSHYTDAAILSPSIEITSPGFPKKSLAFTPKSVNLYRSIDLGLNCDDNLLPIPDGLYIVKYSIFPSTDNYVEKMFYRVDNLICRLEEKFLEVDISECNCNNNSKRALKKQLQEIRLMIEGIMANSNACDFDKASYLYKMASKSLDNMKNCEC